jgi:hypothetical protein
MSRHSWLAHPFVGTGCVGGWFGIRRRAVWTIALTRRRRSAREKLSQTGKSPDWGVPSVGAVGVVAVRIDVVSRLACGVIGVLLSTRYPALAQVAHEGREITQRGETERRRRLGRR